MPIAPGAIITVLLIGLLLWACVTDLQARLIPNRIPALIIVLFMVALIFWPEFRTDWVWRLASFAIAFSIGFAMFAAGVMGGGDVKLFAALALFHNLSSLAMLALTTSIAGAGVALLFAGVDYLKTHRSKDEDAPSPMQAAMRSRVPYGVGIFLGQMWTMAVAGLTA